MPKGLVELDEMLRGGGDESAWLDLLAQPDAEQQWNKAIRRRTTLDDVAEGVRDQPWLAERLLALGRALRRTASTSPPGPALTMRQPELTALLRESPPRQGLTISWGQRAIQRTRAGEVLHVASGRHAAIWYATRAGEGVLPGAGWRVEEGDLPLLLVVADAQADTMGTSMSSATMVAGCLFLSEAENRS